MLDALGALRKKNHHAPVDGKHVEVAVRQIAYYFSDKHLESPQGKYMNDKMVSKLCAHDLNKEEEVIDCAR